jgi:hypothetical protein
MHDVNILDEFLPEAGAFYVMDRGYIDFERLFIFTLCSAFFVVRTKENVLLHPPEASWPRGEPLPNSTDFESYAFRKSPHFTSA